MNKLPLSKHLMQAIRKRDIISLIAFSNPLRTCWVDIHLQELECFCKIVFSTRYVLGITYNHTYMNITNTGQMLLCRVNDRSSRTLPELAAYCLASVAAYGWAPESCSSIDCRIIRSSASIINQLHNRASDEHHGLMPISSHIGAQSSFIDYHIIAITQIFKNLKTALSQNIDANHLPHPSEMILCGNEAKECAQLNTEMVKDARTRVLAAHLFHQGLGFGSIETKKDWRCLQKFVKNLKTMLLETLVSPCRAYCMETKMFMRLLAQSYDVIFDHGQHRDDEITPLTPDFLMHFQRHVDISKHDNVMLEMEVQKFVNYEMNVYRSNQKLTTVR
eukprot:GHVH01010871.1.p1 GENE.GHVH01010871.1~~GHVH01010871.1.p1  ORF type:complete len:333 (+),score=28.84 GHVH01010871.1:684-1682(+)